MKIRVVHDSKKLGRGSRFDKTQPKHQHNIVYHAACANKKCESNYIGETGRRLIVRATDHNKRDKKSHLLKHAQDTKHRRVWLQDFRIIGQGYKSKYKRRISEALYIKGNKPDLNVQKDAYRLSLFNWSDLYLTSNNWKQNTLQRRCYIWCSQRTNDVPEPRQPSQKLGRWMIVLFIRKFSKYKTWKNFSWSNFWSQYSP